MIIIWIKMGTHALKVVINRIFLQYELIFYNVKNVSNENIFKFHDEFILELKINKTKVYIGLDTEEYLDLSFSYKDFEVKDF